jgi:hypothetical protein
MARIRVGWRRAGRQHSQWLDVDDATAVRRQVAGLLDPEKIGGSPAWKVLAYEGLPDFGMRPDLDELLAYLDAVDEYGEPFEAWWATQSFDRVIQAADAFADRYQGTYADAAAWAQHYLALIGEPVAPGMDLEAYGRAAASEGEVQFIDAAEGGIHVFWND